MGVGATVMEEPAFLWPGTHGLGPGCSMQGPWFLDVTEQSGLKVLRPQPAARYCSLPGTFPEAGARPCGSPMVARPSGGASLVEQDSMQSPHPQTLSLRMCLRIEH